MWLIWVIAALLLGLIEILVVDLTFLMFAGGALAAMGVSFFTDSLSIQVGVFAVVSTLLLFLVRPWARNLILSSVPNIRTNAAGLLGKPAVALSTITYENGRVKLEGEEWSAKLSTRAAGPVPAGTKLVVEAIDGAYAVVNPAN
ncbi:NfeD family protein [Buchananella felis]|uniref:NfeD family protein n=1 Tax=Buchananella felis TaxID=3231492 RepID=UPI00352718F8